MKTKKRKVKRDYRVPYEIEGMSYVHDHKYNNKGIKEPLFMSIRNGHIWERDHFDFSKRESLHFYQEEGPLCNSKVALMSLYFVYGDWHNGQKPN